MKVCCEDVGVRAPIQIAGQPTYSEEDCGLGIRRTKRHRAKVSAKVSAKVVARAAAMADCPEALSKC